MKIPRAALTLAIEASMRLRAKSRSGRRGGEDVMVGVVLATHGRLAEELLRATEQICGECRGFRAMTLSVTSALENAREALAEAIEAVDEGDGVLVLTDMFGGSPSNVALTFLDDHVEVVTGVNLPMLLKLATLRADAMDLAAVARLVASDGRKSILSAREFLNPGVKVVS
jgi:mannose PTS system EIIA component